MPNRINGGAADRSGISALPRGRPLRELRVELHFHRDRQEIPKLKRPLALVVGREGFAGTPPPSGQGCQSARNRETPCFGPLSDACYRRGSDRNGEPIWESQRLHFAPAERPSVELQ